jgi:hypothetical protein
MKKTILTLSLFGLFHLAMAQKLSSGLSNNEVILTTLPQNSANITRAYSVKPINAVVYKGAPQTTIPSGGTGNTILVFYKKVNGQEQATVLGDMVIGAGNIAAVYWSWKFNSYTNAADNDATLQKLDISSLTHIFDKARSSYPGANIINPVFILEKITNEDAANKIKNIMDHYSQFENSQLK